MPSFCTGPKYIIPVIIPKDIKIAKNVAKPFFVIFFFAILQNIMHRITVIKIAITETKFSSAFYIMNNNIIKPIKPPPPAALGFTFFLVNV